MIKVFTSDGNAGFKAVNSEQTHCSILMFNKAVIAGNLKTDKLFNFAQGCIKTGNGSLVKAYPKEFLAAACNERGLRLLDIAILHADMDFVKFLVEDCDAAVNAISFKLGQTSIQTVLELDPLVNPDVEKHAKIAGYIIKNGGFAFSLDDYEYDTEYVSRMGYTPSEVLSENVRYATIDAVENFIYNCVEALGKDTEKDEALLSALEVFADMGFLPPAEVYAQDNYVKYNLPYLFSIETRGVMQSATLSNVMSEYAALSVDRFESALDEAVTTNNVIIGTFNCNKLDGELDDETQELVEDIEAAYGDLDADDDVDDELDPDGDSEDYQEGRTTDDPLDTLGFRPADLADIEGLEPLSEEEIAAIEDEDGLTTGYDVISSDDIEPVYNYYELLEIAKGNKKYASENKCVEALYQNMPKTMAFVKACAYMENIESMLLMANDRYEYLKRVNALRQPDSVDHFLDTEVEREK